MPAAAAFVLAGGRSTRMGSDKALLRYGEQTLLQRALQTLAQVSSSVKIVGPGTRYGSFGNIVEDVFPNCGPLGGIHAALSHTDADFNLVVSVDMPLVSVHFLKWLVDQADGEQLITVPYVGGKQQPLCAVYHRSTLEVVRRALENSEYKVGRLFAKVATRVITEEEIGSAGFSPSIFDNVNTPEDFARLVEPKSLHSGERTTQ